MEKENFPVPYHYPCIFFELALYRARWLLVTVLNMIPVPTIVNPPL